MPKENWTYSATQTPPERAFYVIFVYMIPKNTAHRAKWKHLIWPGMLVLGLTLFGFLPAAVEAVYSLRLYPAISWLLRLLTRYIPFSLGDLIYIAFVIRLIIKFIQWIVLLVQRRYTRQMFAFSLFRLCHFLLWAWVVFKLVWGLNYDRQGIASQLQIEKQAYTKEEMIWLTNLLIDKVNENRRLLPDTVLPVRPLDSIYREAYRSYQTRSYDYEFLNYRNRSVKRSLFTPVADYMGFSGYYNPFTGEAQLRDDIPRVMVPYITCHEMAHQLGYASESEANFVGYLAAAASKDPYFRYSVYLDLFTYAQGEELEMLLFSKNMNRDSFELITFQNRKRLDTLVKQDRRAIREFFLKRKNHVSPAVNGLYDQYLKMNRQREGIRSYDEVLGWLLAYVKKYKKI
jgi:hypothetical protein